MSKIGFLYAVAKGSKLKLVFLWSSRKTKIHKEQQDQSHRNWSAPWNCKPICL